MKKYLLPLLLVLSSCASVQSISLTNIPAQKGKRVHAEASRVIFLGFNFDNDYVDNLVNDLKRQCPDGTVSGLLTKDQMIDYFLMIVHKRLITAEGVCLQGKVASNSQPRKTASETNGFLEANPGHEEAE